MMHFFLYHSCCIRRITTTSVMNYVPINTYVVTHTVQKSSTVDIKDSQLYNEELQNYCDDHTKCRISYLVV